MFIFVVSYALCFIVFFSLTDRANKIFGFLVGKQKGRIFKGKGDEPPSHRSKEILIKTKFHLIHKEKY